MISVTRESVYHYVYDKIRDKKLITPDFGVEEYWDRDHWTTERLCHGHEFINIGFHLNKCIKNEWIVKRYCLSSFFNYPCLNNGHSMKLFYCRSALNEQLLQQQYENILQQLKYNELDYYKMKSYAANKHPKRGLKDKRCKNRKNSDKNKRIKKNKYKYYKYDKHKHYAIQQALNDCV